MNLRTTVARRVSADSEGRWERVLERRAAYSNKKGRRARMRLRVMRRFVDQLRKRPVLRVQQSAIHGVGIFALRRFRKGDTVPTVIIDGHDIGYGGFNHSCDPNCTWYREYYVAQRTITPGAEVVSDWRLDGTRFDPCLCPRCLRGARLTPAAARS